jgi:hypothetical protein
VTKRRDASSRAGFIAAMVWASSLAGYGPSRTHRVLGQTPDLGQRLAATARVLADDGASLDIGTWPAKGSTGSVPRSARSTSPCARSRSSPRPP